MNPQTSQRLFLAAGFIMLTLAGGMIMMSISGRMQSPAEPSSLIDPAYATEVNHPAPDFTLTDIQGQPFSSESLKGDIWVVDFFFTRCQLVCPIMTQNMSVLRDRLKEQGLDDIKLVSISVDPEHDTPALLTEYAARYKGDPKQWTFLTGDRATIWPLVEEGFQLALDDDPGNDLMPITHSSRFLVVNREGIVTASFDGITAGSIDALTQYLAVLDGQR